MHSVPVRYLHDNSQLRVEKPPRLNSFHL